MNTKFHRYLLDGLSARSESDYEPVTEASEENALIITDQAKEFLKAAKDFLKIK